MFLLSVGIDQYAQSVVVAIDRFREVLLRRRRRTIEPNLVTKSGFGIFCYDSQDCGFLVLPVFGVEGPLSYRPLDRCASLAS